MRQTLFVFLPSGLQPLVGYWTLFCWEDSVHHVHDHLCVSADQTLEGISRRPSATPLHFGSALRLHLHAFVTGVPPSIGSSALFYDHALVVVGRLTKAVPF